jgi:hypothetical protein
MTPAARLGGSAIVSTVALIVGLKRDVEEDKHG